MAKPVGRNTVVKATEEGGLVRAEVLLSPTLSSLALKRAGGRGEKALREAAATLLLVKKPASKPRVTVVVPRWLEKAFAELCERERTSVSTRLGGRIRRYVGFDGSIKNPNFVRRALPSAGLRPTSKEDARKVQVSLSVNEARGFASLCRIVGINKGAFLIGEMLFLIEDKRKRAERERNASAGVSDTGSG
jgi:hypothetical protein